MRVYVSRLVKCGIPRLTAICLVRCYKRDGKMDALDEYTKKLEAEHERLG